MDLEQLNNHIAQLTSKIEKLHNEREKYKKQKNKYKSKFTQENNEKTELEAISEILGDKLTAEKNKNKKMLERLEKIKKNNFTDVNFGYSMMLGGHYHASKCSICLEKFSDKHKDTKGLTLMSNCSHCFCTECIDQWENDACPECKCEFNTKINL